MTNKYGDKYRVHESVKFNYSQIGEYIGENYTDKPLRNDELVDLLNKQDERIKKIGDLLNEQEVCIKKLKLEVEMLKQIKPLHKLPKTINLVLENGDVDD